MGAAPAGRVWKLRGRTMTEARAVLRDPRRPERDLAAAYHLALRVTGNEALAEDAVQEAFVRVLREPSARPGREPLTNHILRAVHLSALDILRSEGARRRREEGYAMERSSAPASPASAAGTRELAAAAQRELADLPAEIRIAVALCCEQGFSQEEAARITGVPQRTISHRVQRGLERLRGRLSTRVAALSAVALGNSLRSLGVPPAPAHVVRRVGGLAAKVQTVTHPAAGAAAAKGGFAMKVLAGVVLAGTVAGAVAVVGGSGGSLPAEKPRKFDTPVTHPGAEWHREGVWAGCGIMGYLDGPRREIFVFTGPSPTMWFEWAGDFNLRKYDEDIDRYLTVTGGANGCMDGPFTRARFGGWNYGSSGVRTACSPDGRYMFMSEPKVGGRLRILDFEKREVRTLLEKGNACALDVDSKGNVYTIGWGGDFKIVNAEGKIVKQTKLPGNYEKQSLIGHGFCARLDEKNNRLWGMKRNGLYLWYWDLSAGGKIVPVLRDFGKKSRGKCVTGPFEGTQMHCPSGFAFGPGDPEHRFGYMGGGDDSTFYRLDFEKKEWVMFGPPKEHEKRPFKIFRFVHHKGKFPCNSIVSWCGTPGWDEEDNIYLGVALGARTIRYKRVK